MHFFYFCYEKNGLLAIRLWKNYIKFGPYVALQTIFFFEIQFLSLQFKQKLTD